MSAPDGSTSDPEPVDVLGANLARLTSEDLTQSERSRLLVGVSGALAGRAKSASARTIGSGRWLADVLLEAAPHIPIRDLNTLSAHHHGLEGEALAAALVANAAKLTTGIGAAAGAAAAAQWMAMPLLIAVPVEVVVETLAVAMVEVKLVGELHAAYRVPVPGNGTARALAFTQAWTQRRGVDPLRPWTISSALSSTSRIMLANRLMRRLGRNLSTVIPFFVGAWFGARTNRAETLRLGEELRRDLPARRPQT